MSTQELKLSIIRRLTEIDDEELLRHISQLVDKAELTACPGIPSTMEELKKCIAESEEEFARTGVAYEAEEVDREMQNYLDALCK